MNQAAPPQGRAPAFPSPEAKRAFEQQEKNRAEVHPLDWQDDFGPLKYSELTRCVMHMQAIDRERDLEAQHALCLKYGYADIFHFGRVQRTFLKYWGDPSGEENV